MKRPLAGFLIAAGCIPVMTVEFDATPNWRMHIERKQPVQGEDAERKAFRAIEKNISHYLSAGVARITKRECRPTQ